ncbi:hypothetical protein TrispH2_011833, partial [Trichoplax sp. H2]
MTLAHVTLELTIFRKRLGQHLNVKFRNKLEELYRKNFNEIRHQLKLNLYARLAQQLKQNDDILQVIQA